MNLQVFLGGSSTKKCNHDCDQALIKSQLRICVGYSELMLWLYRGKFCERKMSKNTTFSSSSSC